MLLMVEATEAFSWVMMNTPRKLKTAAMMTAERTRMQRVVTQVAMALGASVHPLTKITPSVSNVVTSNAGLVSICWMKVMNETSNGLATFLLSFQQ